MQSLCNLSLRAHTEISSSIRFCLFVCYVFFISGFKIPRGHGSVSISCSARNWVTYLCLWHGTPLCMNMRSLCQKNTLAHSCSWGSRHCFFYWSWFILPLTICRRAVPKTLITLHTMTWMGCFTLCLHADAYEHRARATAQPWLHRHSQRIRAC